ncbi:hypothetical protein ACFYO2_12080 [Streptomyces sp. NPDC006602]|uniref:hypothetical protein n=1 Tax=Streptomyces sp. NPDC006602 TaxID=3364751 RepID=UPI0036C5C485
MQGRRGSSRAGTAEAADRAVPGHREGDPIVSMPLQPNYDRTAERTAMVLSCELTRQYRLKGTDLSKPSVIAHRQKSWTKC